MFKICLIAFAMFSLLAAGYQIPGKPEIDLDFQRVQLLNDSDNTLSLNLKVTRFNKTTFVINGNGTLHKDLRDGYDVEVVLYQSSKGNNQYVLHPAKIPKQSFCDIINGSYRKYVMNRATESASNLPYTTDTSIDICTLSGPGYYYMKDYLFDKSTLPNVFDNGMYKLLIYIYKGNEITNVIMILVRITNTLGN